MNIIKQFQIYYKHETGNILNFRNKNDIEKVLKLFSRFMGIKPEPFITQATNKIKLGITLKQMLELYIHLNCNNYKGE